MAQTSIGRAALVLTTNGSGLRSGLEQEGGRVKKWAEETGRSINAKVAPAGKAAGESAAGGLVAGLATIAGPAAIAAAAIGTVKGAADTLQDLGRQGNLATALGLTSAQFTGLSGVFARFDLDAQATSDVLTDVADWIQDAAVNGGELAETFGFLGVNAKELNGLRPDQQFLAIADAFQKIDPTLAAGLAARLGGDFQKLLPVLRQGGGAIQEMGAKLAVSSREMQTAQKANEALNEAGSALGRAWRAISIALAPVVTLIGKGVSAAVELATPVLKAYGAYTNFLFGIVSRVWGGIRDVITRVWDRILQRAQPVFAWFERAWAAVEEVAEWAWEGILSIVVPAVEQIVSWVEQAIDAVADWAGELLGFTNQWPSFRDVVVFAFRQIGTAGAYAWDVIKAGAGAVTVALGFMVEEALAPVISAFKELVGLSAELPDAIRPEWVDQMNAALADADTKVAGLGAQMQDLGRAAIDSFGNSAVQFNSWLDRMLARQKGATAEAKAAAKDAALAVAKPGNTALLKGTSAEVSARLKYEFGKSNEAAKQLEEQKRANGLLGGILGAAKAIAEKPAGAELAPF